jgi:hypothetical protein
MTITIIDISPGSTVVIKDGYASGLSEAPRQKEVPTDAEPELSEVIVEKTNNQQPLTDEQIAELHHKYRL